MRTLLLSMALIMLIISCNTISYYKTPNDLRNISGTLYLANGETVDGKLIVGRQSFTGNAVKIYLPGEKTPQKYNLFEVKGYEVRGQYYELKEIRGDLSLGGTYSFMKRLTKADSKIQLFENMEKIFTTTNNTSTTHFETEYFMQLPYEAGDAVWPLGSSKFVPNFDEKMSRLVQDCEPLAQKITDKKNGYFYAQVSLSKEKRADVLWNIINEYNKCR
jgi:hypothetical protein